MKKVDRIKELEKIAGKLGIGQNRKVKCVSCKKVILFKNAILLTNKEKVSHICKECNKKLTNGELTKKQIDSDEILKEIEKLKKADRVPVPYIPNTPDIPPMIPRDPDIVPWKPVREPYILPWETGTIKYMASNYTYSNSTEGTGDSILKLEPNKND